MSRETIAVRLLTPSLIMSALLTGAALVLHSHYPTITTKNVWAIGIYTGTSPCTLSHPPTLSNPILTAADVSDVKADFVADPFMMRQDTTWYMFFEVMNALTGHGDIGLATSNDGFGWRYDRIVLDEPFHLSYPCVFAHGDNHFMIPESHRDRTVRLYRATAFPYGWTVEDTLLHGDFVDPTACHYNGRWWLFVCSPSHDELRLYGAATLTGPWREHPASPIVKDNPHDAQPAGRFVAWNGGLVRYAHDDKPTYGKMVRAFHIVTLTETDYEERRALPDPVLRPPSDGWNRHGMHHVDPHRMPDGTYIACVDGYRRVLSLSIEY